MQATLNYKDLAAEVEILKIRIKDLETEHKRLRKMMFANAPKGATVTDYGKERVQSSFAPYPLDEIVVRLAEIEKKIEPLYDQMEQKKDTLRAIKEQVDSMKGIQHKIAYMRDIEGKSLLEISMDLGYSYDRIRHLAPKVDTMTAQNG